MVLPSATLILVPDCTKCVEDALARPGGLPAACAVVLVSLQPLSSHNAMMSSVPGTSDARAW